MRYMLSKLILVAGIVCCSLNAEELVSLKNDFPPSVCGFPKVQFPDDVVVLGVGAYKGRDTIYQISGAKDVATQIDVAVNYKDKPVALFLGAYEATIWNIAWTEGTNIVAAFADGYHRQHIAGLRSGTPKLISVSEENGPCRTTGANFRNGKNTNPKLAEVEQALSATLFRSPISKIFSVTEDQNGKVVVGDPLDGSEELRMSNNATAESFFDKRAPLVRQAGLDQAVEKGVLRRATLDDASRWSSTLKKKYELQNLPPPDIPPDLTNAYVVLKSFTLPAGLYGVHRATFYIPEGVPMPKGDFGHSAVFDFNSISLTCSAGSPCGKKMSSGAIGGGATQTIMRVGR